MKIKTQIFENFNNPPSIGENVFISPKNIHHLKNVLRIKAGEFIRIIANHKFILIGEIFECKKDLICNIVSLESISEESSPQVTICFAICKAPQNELVAEKLTELGTKNIFFWISEHTPFKITDVEKKRERLESIIEGASRQSKQTFIPNCNIFKSLKDTITFINSTYKDNLILYGSLEKERIKIKDIKFSSKNIFIFIGPEGDFSNNEYQFLKDVPSIPISLGNSILKAETSAIVAVSQVMGTFA